MTIRVTINAKGDLAFHDYRGLQGILSGAVKAGESRAYDLTREQWNALRPELVKFSQARVEIIENSLRTGRFMPLMTYGVELLPGGRPRVHQIEGAVSLGGATQSIVLRGENLIQGFQAQVILKKGTTAQVTLRATRKGPVGNLVAVKINKVPTAVNAGSVTVTRRPHGGALIEVTPPDVGTSATGGQAGAIVSQINASAEAARFVTAIGTGTGTLGPIQTVELTGGDGTGIAHLDLFTAVAGSYLRLEARAPGNGGNDINVRFIAAAGAGALTVTGNEIVVTPAAAGATLTAVATQINNNANARKLIKATAIGVGGTAFGVTAIGKNYLYGGSGDDVVARIGGAVVRITDYTDTAVTLGFEGSGDAADVLTPAGLAAGEQALVTLLSDYGVIQAGQLQVAA